MIIIASQRYVRQAPRKVRLVANSVKSLPLEQAFRQLAVMPRSASVPVMKTLRQAVANAQNNHSISPQDLIISSIVVENGPIYKRFRAVSRGRAHSIQKKTCHITVTLENKIDKQIVSQNKDAKKAESQKASSVPEKTKAGARSEKSENSLTKAVNTKDKTVDKKTSTQTKSSKPAQKKAKASVEKSKEKKSVK